MKRAEFQSTNDPNLEIALALSASMASTAGEAIETKSEKVEEFKKVNSQDQLICTHNQFEQMKLKD